MASALLALSSTVAGSSPQVAPESWSAYFPRDIGTSCGTTLPAQSSTVDSNVTTTNGSIVSKLISVRTTSNGTIFTFRATLKVRETESNSETPPFAPITSTQTLEYVLLKNGTVEAPFQKQVNFQDEASVRGHFLFPSIADIKEGITETTEMHFSFSPSTPAGAADFEELTKGHVKTLIGTQDVQVSGELRKSIVTPSGTFRNVVGLRNVTKSVAIQNAVNPQIATQLDAEFLEEARESTTTIWYAPGRGTVSIWYVSPAGKRTIEDTRCTSAEGLTVSMAKR
ncbi:MAG: hypothetical protein WA359_00515 [Acidimicrobiales bacterium]